MTRLYPSIITLFLFLPHILQAHTTTWKADEYNESEYVAAMAIYRYFDVNCGIIRVWKKRPSISATTADTKSPNGQGAAPNAAPGTASPRAR